jgi:hypothetical protein
MAWTTGRDRHQTCIIKAHIEYVWSLIGIILCRKCVDDGPLKPVRMTQKLAVHSSINNILKWLSGLDK